MLTNEEGKGNLLDGRWVGSVGGGRLELKAALDPGLSLGSWPTSGPPDVELALGSSETALADWFALQRPDREARLIDAAERLTADREGIEQLALGTGLRVEEVERHFSDLRAEVAGDPGAGTGATSAGWAVCAPHWSDLIAGVLRMIGSDLVAGRGVLLVADPRLPILADRAALALLAAGVPGGVLRVLHGLTREGRAAAVGGEQVQTVAAVDDREQIAWWRTECQAAGAHGQRFGVPRVAVAEVQADSDLERRAEEIVRGAFGRAETLSGQRRGQIARVFCPERSFSRFTAALLAEVERSEAASDPLPLVDADADEHVRRQWAVGLDDGATLVFGGESLSGKEGIRERRVAPTVFTNVEEHMACAKRQAPMPILCLLRSRDGAV